jgi:hypothetical protein
MWFVGQRSKSQLLKIEQFLYTFFVSARYLKNEMSDLNETCYTCLMSFRSNISFLRYYAETKKVLNFCSIFRSCDLDLCPTNLNIKNEMSDLNETCYTCLMVKGGSLSILRFVGQRSRSQLLKIEQKFSTFFVSA